MKKSLLLLFVLTGYCILKSDAQNPPAIEWQESIGGSGNDEATSIQQTSDGGFIAAGDATSNDVDISGNHGGADYLVLKLDATGTIEWQKCLGGSSDDYGTSVQQTMDGGYIVAGFSKSNDGDVTGHHGTTAKLDYWIVKLNSLGTIQWQKSLGGTSDEFATSIQQTADSGYVVAGWSYSTDGDVSGHHGGTSVADYWIVRLSSSGTLTWQKSLGGNSMDFANSIQQTPDGGFIVAGATASFDNDVVGNHGSFDFWIVKLDSDGIITWQKCLGGTNEDEAFSIQQTADGQYIVAGYTASNGGNVTGYHGGVFWGDYWIVKLYSSGNIAWQECLGGTNDDVPALARETEAGEFIIAGWTESSDDDVTVNYGSSDAWIVQLNVPDNIDQPAGLTFSSSVFPNPATNLITLQVKLQKSGLYTGANLDNAAISITNVFGKTVFQKTSPFINGMLDEEISLNNDFTQGMYLVKVSSGQQHWEQPLMVVK